MMRIIVLSTLLIGFQVVLGQTISSNYKLEGFISSQSFVFWKKVFEDVSIPISYPDRKYETEAYVIQYNNNTRSKSINVGVGFNWFTTDKFELTQRVQFGIGTFNETVNQRLSSFGNGDTTQVNLDYIAAQLPEGYKSSASFFGTERSVMMEVIGTKKWKSGWVLGGGIGLIFLNRDTRFPTVRNGYAPIREERGNGIDRQVNLYGGVTFYGKKQWNQFGIFLAYNQSLISKKIVSSAGNEIGPTALNLNYRLPSIIQVGLSFSFLEAKNR